MNTMAIPRHKVTAIVAYLRKDASLTQQILMSTDCVASRVSQIQNFLNSLNDNFTCLISDEDLEVFIKEFDNGKNKRK